LGYPHTRSAWQQAATHWQTGDDDISPSKKQPTQKKKKKKKKKRRNKMSWRAAGWTFVRANSVAASMLRRVVKPDLRAEAIKRDTPIITLQYWTAGKGAEVEPYTKRVAAKQD
jgi:F-type H+-transporting ATPase subunit epsilon